VDTLGGHVHGHISQTNVSNWQHADDEDKADDERAKQEAFRAVFDRGMYDDEPIN
jgi:hypothetical protein